VRQISRNRERGRRGDRGRGDRCRGGGREREKERGSAHLLRLEFEEYRDREREREIERETERSREISREYCGRGGQFGSFSPLLPRFRSLSRRRATSRKEEGVLKMWGSGGEEEIVSKSVASQVNE